MSKVKQSPTAEDFGRWIGLWITALAMIPQGLLAGLLMDHIIRSHDDEPDPAGRTIAFLFIAFAALEGKRRLITFFNTNSFEELGEAIKKALEDANWKNWPLHLMRYLYEYLREDKLRALNHIISIIPSLVFAYLAHVALARSAVFADSYHTDFTDVLASIFRNLATSLVLGGCSFIANMLSFPGLHERGLMFLKGRLSTIFASEADLQASLKAKAKLNFSINPRLEQFNRYAALKRLVLAQQQGTDAGTRTHLLAAQGYAALSAQLAACEAKLVEVLQAPPRQPEGGAAVSGMEPNGAIPATASAPMPLEDIVTRLKALSDATLAIQLSATEVPPQTPSTTWARTADLVGLSIGGICTAGLSNFFTIGSGMAATFLGLSAYPAAQKVFGSIMMFGMTCMAMHVAQDMSALLQSWGFGMKQVTPEILSKNRLRWINLSAFTVCALGTFPNVYQSLVIVDQEAFLVAAAALASFLLEYGGFRTLTRMNYERTALKQLEDAEAADTTAEGSGADTTTLSAMEAGGAANGGRGTEASRPTASEARPLGPNGAADSTPEDAAGAPTEVKDSVFASLFKLMQRLANLQPSAETEAEPTPAEGAEAEIAPPTTWYDVFCCRRRPACCRSAAPA